MTRKWATQSQARAERRALRDGSLVSPPLLVKVPFQRRATAHGDGTVVGGIAPTVTEQLVTEICAPISFSNATLLPVPLTVSVKP